MRITRIKGMRRTSKMGKDHQEGKRKDHQKEEDSQEEDHWEDHRKDYHQVRHQAANQVRYPAWCSARIF